MRKLAAILRVAIALDRVHDGTVRSIACRRDLAEPNHLTITLDVEPGADTSLELYTAAERSGLLADALGVSVSFATTDDPVPGSGTEVA